MCGCYEIIFTCSRDQVDKVTDYLRHYDFERIDPSTQPDISYFSVYGKGDSTDLMLTMTGLTENLKKLKVQNEIVKFGWMKDE